MKRIIGVFILTVCSYAVYAQQEISTVQYMFSGLTLNPAYAGMDVGFTLNGIYRNQWAIEGSPRTQIITAHGELTDRPSSLGLMLYRDTQGYREELSSNFSYAYRVQLSDKGFLSMGVQLTLHNYNYNYAQAATEDDRPDAPDPVALNISTFTWNAGAGLLYHSDKLYVGFSVPQFLKKEIEIIQGTVSETLLPHYNFTAGYAIDLSDKLVLRPNVLLRYVKNAPLRADLNANLHINNRFLVGASVREGSVTGIFGIEPIKGTQISYAIDFPTTPIDRLSHEIVLRIQFRKPEMMVDELTTEGE